MSFKFIVTTQSKVNILKKQAKRLQREGAGQHVALLDRVAQSAGYDHWNHVIKCSEETAHAIGDRSLSTEIESVVAAEVAGDVRLIRTGPEAASKQPFILFSSGIGDAWLLEPKEDRALCLVWRGIRQQFHVRDLPQRVEIMWDGRFEMRGDFFVASTENPDIGTRAIAGYPLEQLRTYLEKMRTVERKMDEVFGQEDTVPLTSEVIEQLVKSGWQREELERAVRQGAHYSPARDSVLFPPVLSN
jgi:hypothetical protein